VKIPIPACLLVLTAFSCTGRIQAAEQLLNLAGVPKEERTKIPLEFTWPSAPGEAAICMWKDDKLGVISYTIDDNCAQNIDWWLKETAERGIKVTWFLVADHISNRNVVQNGTWERWAEVFAQGHGFESHSMTHFSGSRDMSTWKGLEWEYGGSKKLIEEKFPGHRVSSLAYVGGSYPAKNDPALAAKLYSAARGGNATINPSQGIDYLNVRAMSQPNLGDNPEKDYTNAEKIMEPSHQSYRGWVVLVYHYVREEDPGIVASFRKHLDYAVTHKDKLWCGRFGDVIRYAASRETSNLMVVENRPDRIAIKLTDRMSDEYFDFPLTVKVRLPDNWKALQAQQNGKPAAMRIVDHKGAKFALVDVVPDRGEAVLVPQ